MTPLPDVSELTVHQPGARPSSHVSVPPSSEGRARPANALQGKGGSPGKGQGWRKRMMFSYGKKKKGEGSECILANTVF